jgi:hypothetical protein
MLLDKYPEDFSTVSVDMFKAVLQMWKRFFGGRGDRRNDPTAL